MAERKVTTTSNKQILQKLESLDKKVTDLTAAFIGDVEQEKPGLFERVRKLEDWVASEKKLIYLIVSVIVVDIVSRIWALVVR
jgi:hypothetical protein